MPSAVALILLRIALMDVPMQILFYPAVLALVVWQGLFGLIAQVGLEGRMILNRYLVATRV